MPLGRKPFQWRNPLPGGSTGSALQAGCASFAGLAARLNAMFRQFRSARTRVRHAFREFRSLGVAMQTCLKIKKAYKRKRAHPSPKIHPLDTGFSTTHCRFWSKSWLAHSEPSRTAVAQAQPHGQPNRKQRYFRLFAANLWDGV
jgi:hypothetical protein